MPIFGHTHQIDCESDGQGEKYKLKGKKDGVRVREENIKGRETE